MNEEQLLRFFYNEVLGLFDWCDEVEQTGIDPLDYVRRELAVMHITRASLRAHVSDLEKHIAALRAERDELRGLVSDYREFLQAVPHSYENGNVAQGIDEGNYYGFGYEKELMDRANAILERK